MNNSKELLELDSKITNLEQELSKLKYKRHQLTSTLLCLVGSCVNTGNYYYKILSVNNTDKTAEALCVTYDEEEEYSISLIPVIRFEYINSLSLISTELFEKLYKEVMDKITK